MMNRRGLLGFLAAAPVLAYLPTTPVVREVADFTRISPSGSRLTIKKDVIEVHDAQGVLRVRLGYW